MFRREQIKRFGVCIDDTKSSTTSKIGRFHIQINPTFLNNFLGNTNHFIKQFVAVDHRFTQFFLITKPAIFDHLAPFKRGYFWNQVTEDGFDVLGKVKFSLDFTVVMANLFF